MKVELLDAQGLVVREMDVNPDESMVATVPKIAEAMRLARTSRARTLVRVPVGDEIRTYRTTLELVDAGLQTVGVERR